MIYQISSDNIEMSPSMEVMTKEKVDVLDNKLKHIPADLKSVRVVINTAPDNNFEVKIHFTVRGKEYFAEQVDFSLEHALVSAVDILERMFEKDKLTDASKEWEEIRNAKRHGVEDQMEIEEELAGD